MSLLALYDDMIAERRAGSTFSDKGGGESKATFICELNDW